LADYVEEWWKHKLFKDKPSLLENITDRGIRAARYPGVLDYAYEHGYKSVTYAQTVMRREEKAKRKHPDVIITKQDVKLFVGDVRSGLMEIPNDSVDLVFCDPPYDLKSVNTIYKSIADVSARTLKDGASLLVLVGGAHLPKVLSVLTSNKDLRFHWQLIVTVPRCPPEAPLRFKKVASMYKSILWLTKGPYKGDIIPDIYYASPDIEADKEYHIWGAPENVVSELIERLTEPGMTVADFCIGGGCTALCAARANRKFWGYDLSTESIKITKKRVNTLFGG
jgi:DNA modification methylase